MCRAISSCSTSGSNAIKERNVREMRAVMGQLDKLVEEAGEILVSRCGRPIVRILPIAGKRRLSTSSAVVIRAERDERG